MIFYLPNVGGRKIGVLHYPSCEIDHVEFVINIVILWIYFCFKYMSFDGFILSFVVVFFPQNSIEVVSCYELFKWFNKMILNYFVYD